MAEVLTTFERLSAQPEPHDLEAWRAGLWLNGNLDPRDDFEPGDPSNDQGLIEETSQGLRFCIHPAALLLTEPLLAGTISRWNAGLRELEREDYRELSAFELAAKRTMVAASGRAMVKGGKGNG